MKKTGEPSCSGSPQAPFFSARRPSPAPRPRARRASCRSTSTSKGSPKFDALVDAASGYDPIATRRALEVPEGARFLVLATRWSAVSPVFEELVRAIESLPRVFLFVKPHQAESPTPYGEIALSLSAARTRILPPEANLLELLFASDGLITVDSFASSEALVLGRPVLVLNLPGNLGPLVDRGVALGVRRGESIGKALEALLFAPGTARSLEARRKEYIQKFAFGADGRSTERIVECILNEIDGGKSGKP